MTAEMGADDRSPSQPTDPSHAGVINPTFQRRRHVRPNWTDRRATPRSVALEFRAWIAWWSGETFVVVAARLLDISRTGVAVVAEDAGVRSGGVVMPPR